MESVPVKIGKWKNGESFISIKLYPANVENMVSS